MCHTDTYSPVSSLLCMVHHYIDMRVWVCGCLFRSALQSIQRGDIQTGVCAYVCVCVSDL